MKKTFSFLVFTCLFLVQISASTRLDDFLEKIGVTEIHLLESESIYDSIMEIFFTQPLDHRNPDGPSFQQRIYISHADLNSPVVLSMAGYEAPYYYTTEIAAELHCNQIFVEHRYFGKSQPDSLLWNYLNTWQVASDHHRIVKLFSELYSGPWISTGISKGGQAVIYHSYYYPEDVEVKVPYVAPLNFGMEDPRIYEFLDQVGPFIERLKVKHFQRRSLKNQESLLPAFKAISEKKGYTFDLAGGMENAFEYCVLEYSFAYWQWGYEPSNRIPAKDAGPEQVVEHINRVAGFDYFSDQNITEQHPFWYQVLTEMGYYGYDLEPFQKHLRHVENPRFTFTLSPEMDKTFDPELSYNIKNYLSTEAEHFVYIYGEYDTWSATRVMETGNTSSRIFIKKKGSHRTRINNMPEKQKKAAYATIKTYLSVSSQY